MKYQILKTAPKDGMKIEDLFNVDALDIKLNILPEQWHTLFEMNKGKQAIKQVELSTQLINYLYINMGGDDDTPIEQVMAFMYLLLTSNYFSFPAIIQDASLALNLNNICNYLEFNNIGVPAEFLETFQKSITGKGIYKIVVSQYSLLVIQDSTEEEIQDFYTDIQTNVSSFMQGESNINDYLQNLGISLN